MPVGEKERAIAADRSAQGKSELVLPQNGLAVRGPGKEVPRVQLVVTEELEYRPVKGVGSTLDGGQDYAAAFDVNSADAVELDFVEPVAAAVDTRRACLTAGP